jgi:hypothetical protein
MTTSSNLIGPNGRLFAERQPGKDAVTFRVDNTSEAYYNSPYYVQHKNDVQAIPPPRKNVPMQLQLADFTGPEIITAIQRAGKITFHAVGDTGAAKVNHEQTVNGRWRTKRKWRTRWRRTLRPAGRMHRHSFFTWAT